MSADVRRILAAQGLRALAYGFGSVLLGASLDAQGWSTTEVGLLLTFVLAGTVIASVTVARRGDWFGRRRLYLKWVTRARPKTDRIACPWLIRRFIDPDAAILYVPADQVLAVADAEDAASFDAPGARYEHRDGMCTFEVLIDDHGLGGDAALLRLARIVHAADIESELHTDPAGPGLVAIGLGGLDVEADDHRLLERASFVYDALYAWCGRQTAAAAG